jgi:hypothetical protein
MRTSVAFVGAVVAGALLVVGFLFGLNGDQWDWWRWTSWAAALVVASGTVRIIRRRRPTVRLRRRELTIVIVAGLTAGTSIAVMANRFSDPYGGSLVWPHILACVALIGVVVAVWAATGSSNESG